MITKEEVLKFKGSLNTESAKDYIMERIKSLSDLDFGYLAYQLQWRDYDSLLQIVESCRLFRDSLNISTESINDPLDALSVIKTMEDTLLTEIAAVEAIQRRDNMIKEHAKEFDNMDMTVEIDRQRAGNMLMSWTTGDLKDRLTEIDREIEEVKAASDQFKPEIVEGAVKGYEFSKELINAELERRNNR